MMFHVNLQGCIYLYTAETFTKCAVFHHNKCYQIDQVSSNFGTARRNLVQHAVIFGRARGNLGTALRSRLFSWNVYSPHRTILLLHGTTGPIHLSNLKSMLELDTLYVYLFSTKNQDPHSMNHLRENQSVLQFTYSKAHQKGG